MWNQENIIQLPQQGAKDSYLKEEILAVIIRQCLRRLNNLVQIRVHEFINQINILETIPMSRHHDVLQSNHILVVKVAKKLEFTQSPQRINPVLKGILNFLYGNLLIALFIHRRAHNPVSTATDRLDWHVFWINLKQGLPHGEIMLPFSPDSVWRINRSSHFLQIKLIVSTNHHNSENSSVHYWVVSAQNHKHTVV